LLRPICIPALAFVPIAAALVAVRAAATGTFAGGSVQFIFTADAHYGITRPGFRGGKDVGARTVNRALVRSINTLATATFPPDGGLHARSAVGPIDFVVEGGDICNRAEVGDGEAIQTAAESWHAFAEDYIDGLALTNAEGRKAPTLAIPGNHDASNAVGYYKPMSPPTDASAMVAIFNLMQRPTVPLTSATFDYERDRVLSSRDVGGVHFAFLQVWPDSRGRAWLARDLSGVSAETPVVMFAHEGPDPDPRHFRNPNARHDINDTDKFENVLSDELAAPKGDSPDTRAERSALEQFVALHPNASAYFHGHSNFNQFYDWTGPNNSVALHVFRVDSPMKGAVSKDDETKLSFQIATIDMASRTMTVREVFWNANPNQPSLTWGGSTTVALSPRANPEGTAQFSIPGGDQ